MDKNQTSFVVLIIAAFIGLLLTNSVIGTIIAGIFGLFSYKLATASQEQDRKRTKRRDGNLTLLLAAAVIKADGRIYPAEKDFLKKKFTHDFGKSSAEQYMKQLEVCLKQKVQVVAVCHHINREFEQSEKIQILHFLVGISVSDGILTEAEKVLLYKIAGLVGISPSTTTSILAMFNYEYKYAHESARKESNNNGDSRQKEYRTKKTPANKLATAYKILEISSTAADEEVKKAYRRLAKIHHPDRVVHLGIEFQKQAKEKFQKLQEAYDLIKISRGIK